MQTFPYPFSNIGKVGGEKMTKTYNPYKMAKSLGFDDAMARQFERCGTDKAGIVKIAEGTGLIDTRQKLGKPDAEPKPKPTSGDTQAEGKKHQHYYRKNGVCACGRVRKVKAQALR